MTVQIEDRSDKYQKERRSQKEAGVYTESNGQKRVEIGERERGGWEGRHGGKGEDKLEKLINSSMPWGPITP